MKTGKWSKKEEQFLIENVTKLSVKELANVLNRSDGSIRAKKTSLGIKSEKNKPFTEKEKQIIEEWYKKYGDELNLDDLSKLLNRPKTSICRYAKKIEMTDQTRMSAERRKKIGQLGLKYSKTEKFLENSKIGQKLLIERSKNNHYRGMLGKYHTNETKKRMSISHKENWKKKSEEEKQKIVDRLKSSRRENNNYTKAENAYSRCKGGFREDLNQYFRSSWEANIARYFNFLSLAWEYEPRRFNFEDIESGVLSYMPDFYLPQLDIWIEVKGWMNEKSKTQLNYFEQFYPEYYSKLVLIDEEKYCEIESDFKYTVSKWE